MQSGFPGTDGGQLVFLAPSSVQSGFPGTDGGELVF